MKRYISLLVCLCMIIAIAAGCGGNAGSSDSTAATSSLASQESTAQSTQLENKPITITLDTAPAENDKAANDSWNQTVKDFTAKYPNITVKSEFYSYSPETFLPKAESGQLGTMFSVYLTEPAKIIEAGYAADITDVVKKWGYDKLLNPALFNVSVKDGKIYGLPTPAGYTLGLYMNMNLYKKAGLVDDKGLPKIPKTLDELAQNAKIIKEKTGKAGMYIASKDNVGGWHFTNLAWSFGCQFETKVDGKWKATFNSPEGVAALQYVKDLKWKYDVLLPNAMLGWEDWVKNFGTDQVGMVFAASDAVNLPVTSYKMSKDAIAIAAFPAGPKSQNTLMGGGVYMFNSKATPEEIDACLKFLEMRGYTPKSEPGALTAIENDQKNYKEKNQVAGIRNMRVWNSEERNKAADEIFAKYRNVNYDLFKDYFDNNEKNVRSEEPYNTQDLYGMLDSVIQKVLTDKNADPKALLDKAAEEFQTKYLDKVK